MITKEVIIIGGGNSLQNGINLKLEEHLEHRFVIACNYAYKHFPHTFLTFLDKDFYVPLYAKSTPEVNPDIYEELQKEPLIVGINQNGIEEFKLDNTILIDKKYNSNLTGILALKLAMLFIQKGNIFLLGFDWNRRIGLPERDPNYSPDSNMQIHYYNDIKHRGIGRVGFYENHNPDKEFLEFTQKKDVKIYNVSLESNIECFEKISYESMFDLLKNENIKQDELREYIKTTLI